MAWNGGNMSTPQQDNVADRIICRLKRFASQLECGVPLQEFMATLCTKDDLRNWLRNKGWRRCDRASGDGPQELWAPLWDGVGFQPLSVTLPSAVRRQLKADGYITANFGRLS
jgi:hypothetical protein